ncbi:MAG: DUF1640 domain-containing protein [Nitrospirae bacterium]|nr:DUF1640 domain-containing protein [Magnetococcales bacterium]
MSLMFDSLAYAKKLKAAGVPEAQAEIQAETIVEWMEDRLATKLELEHVRADLKRDIKELDAKVESVRADLKRDIESVRAELKRDIKELDAKVESVRADLKRDIELIRADLKRDIQELDAKVESVRSDLKRDIKELEQRMVIKLGSLMFVAVGAMAALVKLL